MHLKILRSGQRETVTSDLLFYARLGTLGPRRDAFFSGGSDTSRRCCQNQETLLFRSCGTSCVHWPIMAATARSSEGRSQRLCDQSSILGRRSLQPVSQMLHLRQRKRTKEKKEEMIPKLCRNVTVYRYPFLLLVHLALVKTR